MFGSSKYFVIFITNKRKWSWKLRLILVKGGNWGLKKYLVLYETAEESQNYVKKNCNRFGHLKRSYTKETKNEIYLNDSIVDVYYAFWFTIKSKFYWVEGPPPHSLSIKTLKVWEEWSRRYCFVNNQKLIVLCI